MPKVLGQSCCHHRELRAALTQSCAGWEPGWQCQLCCTGTNRGCLAVKHSTTSAELLLGSVPESAADAVRAQG